MCPNVLIFICTNVHQFCNKLWRPWAFFMYIMASAQVPVSSGVLQGTVLVPLLCLIYWNSSVSNLNSKYDFCWRFWAFSGSWGWLSNLPASLARRYQYLGCYHSSSWGLGMNPSKCVCLKFSRGRSPTSGPSPYRIGGNNIVFVGSHSDLGVTVEHTQKFHIILIDSQVCVIPSRNQPIAMYSVQRARVPKEHLPHPCKTKN